MQLDAHAAGNFLRFELDLGDGGERLGDGIERGGDVVLLGEKCRVGEASVQTTARQSK